MYVLVVVFSVWLKRHYHLYEIILLMVDISNLEINSVWLTSATQDHNMEDICRRGYKSQLRKIE